MRQYHQWMAQYHRWMAALRRGIAVLIKIADLASSFNWSNWCKYLRVSAASSKAEEIDAHIANLENTSQKLNGLVDDLESRFAKSILQRESSRG